MATTDKRRRNGRPSKYRPRTEDQKRRRQALWEARKDDRVITTRQSEEEALRRRLEDLETALREGGHAGVHRRRHSTPLEDIADEEKRFLVLKARVERLQAIWTVNRRKRETRGKIIIGGALLAEAGDGRLAGDFEMMSRLVDILDRRVDRPLDRLTVRELLGDVPLALFPNNSGAVGNGMDTDPISDQRPDFDVMVERVLDQTISSVQFDHDGD